MRESLQESLLENYRRHVSTRERAWQELGYLHVQCIDKSYWSDDVFFISMRHDNMNRFKDSIHTYEGIDGLTVNDLKFWWDKYYKLREASIKALDLPAVKVYREQERKSCHAVLYSLVALTVSIGSLLMAIHK